MIKQLLVAVAFVLCMIGQARAAAELSYHVDTRNYNTLGVTISRGFPGLGFWGFTDIHAPQTEGSDISYYFMEYRINHTFAPGLGIEAEYNDHTGDNNSLIRLGMTYTTILSRGWNSVRVHPVDTAKNNDMQISNAFAIRLKERWELVGWIDYNIIDHGKNQWVYEPGINYLVTDNLKASVEYRFNGFDGFVPGWVRNGVAFGLIWKM